MAPRSQASRARRTISGVRDEVGLAAQVRRELPLREGAEAAAEVADVRVLDVAGDDVGDRVAVPLAPERVGGGKDALALLAPGAEEPDDLRLAELLARGERQRVAGDEERDLAGLARRPGILAGKPERVGHRATRAASTAGSSQTCVDVARVDGQARGQLETAALGRRAEPVELGPGRLGIDVIDRHRRDAAPVVDPGIEQSGEVAGQVRRRLHRDPGRQENPGDGDRPEKLRERRLRRGRHPRARLRPEVLDDHLLHLRARPPRSPPTPPAARPASRRSRSGSPS